MDRPEPNSWVHLALTYDGISASVYVNGKLMDLVSTGDVGKNFLLPDHPVMFVGKRAGNVRADVHLDSLYVFPYVLNKNELASFQ